MLAWLPKINLKHISDTTGQFYNTIFIIKLHPDPRILLNTSRDRDLPLLPAPENLNA